ncbi:hypothetical protein KI387_006996, partial [Taxus chinensis]
MPPEDLSKIIKPVVKICKEKDNIVLDAGVEGLVGMDEYDESWEIEDEEEMMGGGR